MQVAPLAERVGRLDLVGIAADPTAIMRLRSRLGRGKPGPKAALLEIAGQLDLLGDARDGDRATCPRRSVVPRSQDGGRRECYPIFMTRTAKDILDRVENWPEEDQEELAEMARAIEARRTGVYVLNDEEKAAIDAARRSGLASDEQIAAFWKRVGVA